MSETQEVKESHAAGPAEELAQHWRYSWGWGITLVVMYVVFAALPVVLAFVLAPTHSEGFLTELGKGAGLLGFALLSFQVALSARITCVDGPFGLDLVMHFHKGMAMFTGLLLLAHPLLLAAGAGSLHLFTLGVSWRVTLGKVALLLVLLTIGGALAFKKLGIEYQVWRYGHKAAVLAVPVAFAHGLFIGPDLQHVGLQVYWWLLLGMVVAIFAWRNIYVILWGRKRFTVESVTQESHDTYTLALQPEDGEPIEHLPGQFMFLRLDRPGRPSEEHPFTISSTPTAELPMTASIKESGDFTDTIGQTVEGDGARLEAPYGRFSYVFHRPEKFLFIAGGVGITPIRSMMAHLHDTGDTRPAVLIYGNKRRRDILFRRELEDMPEHVKVVHVLSKPDEDWEGHTGFVTEDIILDEATEVLDTADVYLCGPPPMMDMVIPSLRSLGVPDARIHYERFAL